MPKRLSREEKIDVLESRAQLLRTILRHTDRELKELRRPIKIKW